jgi:hypothetical protein
MIRVCSSQIRVYTIPDPGSRGKKDTESRIRIRNTGFLTFRSWCVSGSIILGRCQSRPGLLVTNGKKAPRSEFKSLQVHGEAYSSLARAAQLFKHNFRISAFGSVIYWPLRVGCGSFLFIYDSKKFKKKSLIFYILLMIHCLFNNILFSMATRSGSVAGIEDYESADPDEILRIHNTGWNVPVTFLVIPSWLS